MHVVKAMSESKSSMDRDQQDKHECTAERSDNSRSMRRPFSVTPGPSYQHSGCAGLQLSLLKVIFMIRVSRPVKTDVQTISF